MTRSLRSPYRAAWLAALALAGCAVGPDFKPETPAAPPSFADWHGGSPALIPPQARTDTAAPAGWTMFGDPVLDALEARALTANADLQGAALRFAAEPRATQRRRVAAGPAAQRRRRRDAAAPERERRDPATARRHPSAQPEQLIQVLSEPHYFYQAGFDASWEIDLWGRVRRAVESADANVSASQALLAQVQLSVQAEVARRYFELRAAQRQIRIARDDIAAAEETLELVKARADGGLTTDLDVTRQSAQAADLRARLPQLLAQEALADNQITLLLGDRPGALRSQLAAPPDSASTAALPDLSLGLPSAMALRRPDIQVAQAQLHAATANIGVAVADLYPRVTLGAGFGFESVDGDSFADWGSRQWSIGPSLQLPIFDGGRRRATVTLRELQQQEAAVSYQQTVLKAWHEIDDALSAYTAERLRNVQLADRERSSRDALQLARVRYDHGLTDFLVQLDAQRTWLQAQREYTESTSRLALGLVAVSKALGGAGELAAKS